VFALKGVESTVLSTVVNSDTHGTSALQVLESLLIGLMEVTELLLVCLFEVVAPFCSLALEGVDTLCTNFFASVPTFCVCLLQAVWFGLTEGDEPLRTFLLKSVDPL
jgi:hypothetical protein